MKPVISSMLSVAVVSLGVAAQADPWKDESGNGRGGAKEFRKQQEKMFEEQRKREEKVWEDRRKQEERYRNEAEKRREKARKHAERSRGAGYSAPPHLPSRQHFYGDAFSRHGYDTGGYEHYDRPRFGYGYGGEFNSGSSQTPSYEPRPPYALPHGSAVDTVYTPFGYHEKHPETWRGGHGPRPYGQGQIGPYYFEVWK